MAKLPPEEIARLALSAGVPRDQAAKAVAIALAESGGDPYAHNGDAPDNSYGLWQINMYGNMGPARRKQFGIANNADLYTPAVNARAMYEISGGGRNWNPWTTYTRGTWMTYSVVAGAAVEKATGIDRGIDIPGVTQLGNIKKAVDTLTNPGTWIVLGVMGLGFVLILIALAKMTGDNKLSATTKAIVGAVVTRKVAK